MTEQWVTNVQQFKVMGNESQIKIDCFVLHDLLWYAAEKATIIDQAIYPLMVQIRVDVNGQPFEIVERDWYDVDVSNIDFELLPYYLKSVNENNEYYQVMTDVELTVRYIKKKLTSVWGAR